MTHHNQHRTVSESTVVLYPDRCFAGKAREVKLNQFQPGTLHDLCELHLENRVASAEWNLPEGVIFTLYETSDGKGMQYTLKDEGSSGDLDTLKGAAASWAWYLPSKLSVPGDQEPKGYQTEHSEKQEHPIR